MSVEHDSMRTSNGSPVGIALLAMAIVVLGLFLWLCIYPLLGPIGCVVTVVIIVLASWWLVRRMRSHM